MSRDSWPSSPPLWHSTPAELTLGDADVHVWRVALDAPACYVQHLWFLLTPDECQRAERFYFPKDRTHFTVARGVLRQLLGRYLDRPPQHLRFTYGTHGKPDLASEMAQRLCFNVSHSHGYALYAVTYGRDIGVDIERIRPDVAQEQIAERFFSPREVAVLRSLPVSLQATAFFACWTRKEAFIKARGDGLSLPLDQFDVTLTPGDPAALLHTAWEPREASHWSLRDLAPYPGYMGAVAVAGHAWQLRCWDWPEGGFRNVETR